MSDQIKTPPVAGDCAVLEPGLRRILAPNPSPMTHWGTNTYLLGTGAVAVVDPGPDDPAHLAAILAALSPGERIVRILLTHLHRDHSALAPALARHVNAPVLAYGRSEDGRAPVMQTLAAQGVSGGGEGLDTALVPDQTLTDGGSVDGITALWTPGHASTHMCFAWNDVILSGDAVMGWASTMVSPPDGDLTAFMTSTRRLQDLGARRFYPGHGAPIDAPSERCAWLLNHRRTREAAILNAIPATGASVAAITAAVYTDTPPALLPAARRNVFAHLIDLTTREITTASPKLSETADFFHRGQKK